MKKFLKAAMFALCFMAVATVVAACAGAKTISKAQVSFKTLAENPDGAYVWQENATVTENGKLITVAVPDGTTGVQIDIAKFLSDNEDFIGKDFSFTRSDITGRKFYAYEENAEGTHYTKVGTTDVVEASNKPNGHLYIKNGSSAVYLYVFASRDAVSAAEDTSIAFGQDKTVRFDFEGHKGGTHRLEVKVTTSSIEEEDDQTTKTTKSTRSTKSVKSTTKKLETRVAPTIIPAPQTNQVMESAKSIIKALPEQPAKQVEAPSVDTTKTNEQTSKTNEQANKVQANKTQPNKAQADKTQVSKTQADKAQVSKTQTTKTTEQVSKTSEKIAKPSDKSVKSNQEVKKGEKVKLTAPAKKDAKTGTQVSKKDTRSTKQTSTQPVKTNKQVTRKPSQQVTRKVSKPSQEVKTVNKPSQKVGKKAVRPARDTRKVGEVKKPSEIKKTSEVKDAPKTLPAKRVNPRARKAPVAEQNESAKTPVVRGNTSTKKAA